MSAEGVFRDAELSSLLRAARAGDSHAQWSIFQQFRPYLRDLAAEELEPELRVKLSSSDVVQDSIVEAKRGFRAFRGETVREPKVWLKGILCNNVNDARRSFHADKRDISKEVANQFGGNGAANNKPLPTPDDEVSRKETAIAVESAILKLSVTQQEVVRLRHREALTFREIGERLNMTEEAVRKVWLRSIEELRLLLRAECL